MKQDNPYTDPTDTLSTGSPQTECSGVFSRGRGESQSDYFVHPSSYVDEGCSIGRGTKIWHFSHIMAGCQIGEDCNIGQNVVISPDVVLGRNCKIQNNVSVYTGVRCEDDVFLGPSMVFTNVINPRAAVSRKAEYRPTILKQGTSVGANATIVCGHTLGEYCLIGAGSVVTKDVPAYALMVGNPARRIGWVSRHGEKLTFDARGIAICPATGEKYQLTDNQVTLLG